MKRIKLNYLPSLVAAVLLLSGCAGLTKMRDNAPTVSYQVKPNPLETHKGEVTLTVDTKFPAKYFNKKAVVVATPVLKYEGGEKEFEPTTLQGESVKANNKVIAYAAGGSYTYTGTIPYVPEMMKSELVVKMSARIKEKTPLEYTTAKIADGVIATSTLVKVYPKTVMMKDNFVRITPESYKADIHYVINKFDVRKSELKGDDIAAFESALKTAKADSSRQFKGAKISAYASPDGPLDLNEKLSGNREGSAEKYLKKAFKDNKITESEAAEFLSKLTTAEDWDGFKELMEKSSIQDKDLILRVLSMYSDPVVREKEVKNISKAYEEIAKDVLPELRRSVMSVNIDVVGLSDEQILDLAKNDPSKLKLEEILYGGTLTQDNAEKLAIYQAAAQNFPESERTHNNVGYVLMQMGKTAEAKAAFEKAKAIKDDEISKCNLGAVALAEGDLAAAENLLAAGMGAGDAASYNLGIIKIKQADYAAAVNYFGSKPSFNAALAQLLNGNADKAMATLNEMGDDVCACVYYLKAVISARAGKEDGIYSNLRSAIGKDPKWKDYAVKDAEFLKYAAGEAFQAIVK
jgi:tetratricopeptide (TPR) repeat protein